MTIEATTWCFARLVRDFEKPGAVRRKAQKEKVENTAESACLLWHLTLDLQAQFPISKEAVEKHILEPWADSSLVGTLNCTRFCLRNVRRWL